MKQNWLTRIFSKNQPTDTEQNLPLKERKSNSAGSGTTKSVWNSHVRNTKTPRIQPDTIEKATIDYILNKYKKEAFESIAEHLAKSGIPGVNAQRVQEIIHFMKAVLQVVEDDFFVGYRLLKKRMIKIDNYLFSQYRKDISLRPNIYKLLVFAQNKRFSNNLRENLTAYFAVIEEMNFEIIQFLEDYYVILEDLEKNPKSTVYLRKDYGIKKTYTSEIEDFATQSEQTILFFTQQEEITRLTNMKSSVNSQPTTPSGNTFNHVGEGSNNVSNIVNPQNNFSSSPHSGVKSEATHMAIKHTHDGGAAISDNSDKLEPPRVRDMFDLDDDEKPV